MKKIIVSVFALAMTLFVSCGSTSSLGGEAKKNGLPKWTDARIFKSYLAESYDLKMPQEGVFVVGVGSNIESAETAGQGELSKYINNSTSTYENRNTDGKGKESYNRIDVSVSASQLKNLQWIDKISADMIYRLGFIEYGDLEQCTGLSHEEFNNLVDEYRSGSY